MLARLALAAALLVTSACGKESGTLTGGSVSGFDAGQTAVDSGSGGPGTADGASDAAGATLYTIDFDSQVDPELQATLNTVDAALRAQHGVAEGDRSAGVFDLLTGRLAMIAPDKQDYAASVPKVAILLTYFVVHPDVAALDAGTRNTLGLMAKQSSNTAATEISVPLGIQTVLDVIDQHDFYDIDHGGGLWFGRHYGGGGERIGDPLMDHSHAATVRQLLRFWLQLEQGQLVSPEVSTVMKEIFASPELEHTDLDFVTGLAGRDVQILRKWGGWQDWHHDSAIISGPGRRYILVGMTNDPNGERYLEGLAVGIDDALSVP